MSDRVDSLTDLSIRDLGAGYRDRSYSPVDVTRAALERIAATESTIHAWVEVDHERALAVARIAEHELMSGTDRGPLHGVPVGIKDIFDVAGFPTRCGSAARFDAPIATEDANSVHRLRAGGAVILGKTVTQEFAAGTISPPARNPWDPERIPGGSSGGSAAAVAVGACFGAMGSDTGGSIRIPAAACGVTGFKPAYGSLHVAGVFPLSWSLDTIGSIARTVDDTWLMWNVLRGASHHQPGLPGDGPQSAGKAIRLGISRPFFFEWLQPDVLTAVEAAIDVLAAHGVILVETPWLEAGAARACGFVINRVEAAAVHGRIAVEQPDLFARYGPDLRVRVAAGRSIPATAYLDAIGVRSRLKNGIASLFAAHGIDALLAPTLPTTALRADNLVITDTGLDESVGAGWTRLTMPFNATGQPVLALPCGRDRIGLPVGMQLAGRPGEEDRLLRIGREIEQMLGFHQAPSPLSGAVNGGSLNQEAK